MMLTVAVSEDQRETNTMPSDEKDEFRPSGFLPKPPSISKTGRSTSYTGGDSCTDTGMSSSEADYHRGGSGSRRSKPSSSSHRRRKSSKSPTRALSERKDSKSGSVRSSRKSLSRARSFAEGEDSSTHQRSSNANSKSSRSSRRRSSMAAAEGNCSSEDDEDAVIKTKLSSSSRDGKSSTTKSSGDGGGSIRKGHSAVAAKNPEGGGGGGSNGRGEREGKSNRRRRGSAPSLVEEKATNTSTLSRKNSRSGGGCDDIDSLPKASDSNSYRQRNRSKSRSRSAKQIDNNLTAAEGSTRTRTERSVRSDRTSSVKTGTQNEESTLDSNAAGSSNTSTTEPSLSLRSSIKVASALVKFRKVLAMSKQATASAQKYRDEREKQAHDIGMDELVANSSSSHKENVKGAQQQQQQQQQKQRTGSSHHRRDGSRHSKHGSRRESRRTAHSDHATNITTTKSNSKGNRNSNTATSTTTSSGNTAATTGSNNTSTETANSNSNHNKTSSRNREKSKQTITRKSSHLSSSNHASASVVDADAFLKEALTSVGKKLSRSSALARKESSVSASSEKEAGESVSPTKPAAIVKTSAAESISAGRLKSSAKVSTAVLKFQQALALSKSATKAAKTQQDTQNKLLSEVHAERKTKPGDYLGRSSTGSTMFANSASALVSPVSALDVVNPADANSPQIPGDLDGDSDIDSEIDIDSVHEEDDTISEVATDSEDERDAVAAVVLRPTIRVDKTPVTAPSPAKLVSATDSDADLIESDVDDHSDVEIDSDDDLDSDGEVGTDAKCTSKTDSATSDAERSEHSDSDSESEGDDAPMDSDDDIDSNCQADTPSGKSTNGDLDMYTPPQSLFNEGAAAAIRSENGSKSGSAEAPAGGSKVAEISKRLLLVRSASVTTRSASDANSSLEKALSDWRSSRDVTASSLAIPGLSPAGSKASVATEEDSQMGLSYLPVSMTKREQALSSTRNDVGGQKLGRVSSSRTVAEVERVKQGRNDLSRKPSNRSVRRSRSGVEKSMQPDPARKTPGEDSLRTKSRSSSRVQKAPSRSRSSCSLAKGDGDAPRERKSKSSSTSGDKSKNPERSKGGDRGVRRSSSATKKRTLAGLSSFSNHENVKEFTLSDKREEVKKPSRRRGPSRAKSHDGTLVFRKTSRSSSSRNLDKDRRSRKAVSPPE